MRQRVGDLGVPAPTGCVWPEQLSGCVSKRLLSDSEPLNEIGVAIGILAFQIVEQASALPDQLEEAAARVMVFRVGLEMFGEVVDPFAQERDLHLGGTGVCVVGFIRSDDFRLAIFRKRHAFLHVRPRYRSSLTPVQPAVAARFARWFSLQGNYNSKRLNILHQNNRGMQKTARPDFGDRNKLPGAIEEPPTGNACPHDWSWVGLGVHVTAMRYSFTVVVAQNNRRDFRQELFQRYDPSRSFDALTLEGAQHDRIAFGKRSCTNPSECFEMRAAAELSSKIVRQRTNVEPGGRAYSDHDQSVAAVLDRKVMDRDARRIGLHGRPLTGKLVGANTVNLFG